ncbi:MAG: dockerin type I repeat-containing protein [Oscillospiraceae bacterium]|nr:dockerin type I repeat-containing protein [Oscillospiraceae bacterium]
MKIKKYLSIASAVSLIASSSIISANAGMIGNDDLYDANAVLSFKIIGESAYITTVQTDGIYFDIPESIEYKDENGFHSFPVSDVDDYAFALCENLTGVYVPDSVTIADTGNVAFLTSSAVMDYLDNELSDAATVDDVIRYIAEKANYKNGDFTDEDLADAAIKLKDKLNMVDISTAETVKGKIMTLLMNVDQMNLNPELLESFNIWIASITYNDFTLYGHAGTEMQKYADAREFLGMKYSVIADEIVLGDANGDKKLTVSDAAFIARTLAKGEKIDLNDNPAADFNQDGKVNVSDAASIARKLASSK